MHPLMSCPYLKVFRWLSVVCCRQGPLLHYTQGSPGGGPPTAPPSSLLVAGPFALLTAPDLSPKPATVRTGV